MSRKPIMGDLILKEDEPTEEQKDIGEAILSRQKQQVLVISSEEELEKYTIEDVCLPLPGFQIKYPENAMAGLYSSYMAKDGFDPFAMERKDKDISLPGFYRRLVSIPRNFSWQFVKHSGDVDLIQSDLQKIRNEALPVADEQSTDTALIVEFTLGSSQYATMALRELMKAETGSGSQSALSAASKDEVSLKRKHEE